jgi:hypothetical protein
MRVRIISPAPVSKTKARAISGTMKTLCSRCLVPLNPRPPSFKVLCKSCCEILSAGARPNKTPAIKDVPRVNSNTRASRPISLARASFCGNKLKAPSDPHTSNPVRLKEQAVAHLVSKFKLHGLIILRTQILGRVNDSPIFARYNGHEATVRVMECGVSTALFFVCRACSSHNARHTKARPRERISGPHDLMQEGELAYWPKVMTPRVPLP